MRDLFGKDGAGGMAEELGQAILPVVRRFLARSTEEFQTIDQRLADSPEAFRDERLLERLETRREGGDRIGWCLGVLAAASGTDLLLARREHGGLRAFASLVLEALGGRSLEPGPEWLPLLATDRGAGWELPLVIGWLLLRIGVRLDPAAPIRWALVEHGREQSFYLSTDAADFPHLPADAAVALPGARLFFEDGALALVLPAGTLLLPDSEAVNSAS